MSVIARNIPIAHDPSQNTIYSVLLFIHDILAQRNRKVDFTITSNKGTWGVMHINGIMITKQFISQ